MCRPAVLAAPTARQRCDVCSLPPHSPQPDFYRALGYAEVGARTGGSEVQRESGGGGFTLAEVQRCVMLKPLPSEGVGVDGL